MEYNAVMKTTLQQKRLAYSRDLQDALQRSLAKMALRMAEEVVTWIRSAIKPD